MAVKSMTNFLDTGPIFLKYCSRKSEKCFPTPLKNKLKLVRCSRQKLLFFYVLAVPPAMWCQSITHSGDQSRTFWEAQSIFSIVWKLLAIDKLQRLYGVLVFSFREKRFLARGWSKDSVLPFFIRSNQATKNFHPKNLLASNTSQDVCAPLEKFKQFRDGEPKL